MRLLVKFPCRERPYKFFKTLDRYYSFATDLTKIRFVITLDADDRTMNNIQTIEKLKKYPNLKYYFGNSKTKIQAVNADINDLEWDILLLASDDMIPLVKGYDEIIRQQMAVSYPDTDGVLWYFDGHRKDLNTLCILGREYYKRFNYIYHPEFITWYADDHFMWQANKLNKQTYIHKCIIEHQHFIWTHQRPDNLAKKENNDKDIKKDRETMAKLTQPKLSLLICTLEKRAESLKKLIDILQKQDLTDVEILTCKDDGRAKVGSKRNYLMDNARGKYVAFIDDDDRVSDNYIELLMQGIDKDVDCCSLTGTITFDGKNPATFIHSLKYKEWFTQNSIYYRSPNHLNCIKRDIAKRFRFPDIDWAEDQNFSKQLVDAEAIKTEHYIEQVIYFYDYKTKK